MTVPAPTGSAEIHPEAGSDEVGAGFPLRDEAEHSGPVVNPGHEGDAGQGGVGELGLEGEVVEELARLDPEAAFEPRPRRGIGETLAESQVDAQAAEEGICPVRNMSASVPSQWL